MLEVPAVPGGEAVTSVVGNVSQSADRRRTRVVHTSRAAAGSVGSVHKRHAHGSATKVVVKAVSLAKGGKSGLCPGVSKSILAE